jgi:hypothetical protein
MNRLDRSAWDRFGRACRLVLLLAMTACALVGALTTPAYVVLLAAPAFGLILGGAAASVSLSFQELASARRVIVLCGAWAALFVPAVAGMGALAEGGAVIAFALMVVGCVVATSWIADTCASSGGSAEHRIDDEQLREFIRAIPTSMLLHEWRSTCERMPAAADPERRADAIRVRTLLLEELSRRDPAGVTRWLSEGDEDAPEQYLRGDSGAST